MRYGALSRHTHIVYVQFLLSRRVQVAPAEPTGDFVGVACAQDTVAAHFAAKIADGIACADGSNLLDDDLARGVID